MLVGTHYRIGGFVYRFIISKYLPFSPVDKILFQAGNVLPDISSELSRLEHTMEGSRESYRQHVMTAQDTSLSSGERLLSLGIACHFLTDSFCVYHAKKSYKKRSILRHLLYELLIHMVLLAQLPSSRKLFEQLLSDEEKRIEASCANPPIADDGRNSSPLQRLFFSLQREYDSQKSSARTDIRFALKATLFSTVIVMEDFYASAPARLVYDVSTPYEGSMPLGRSFHRPG